MLDVPNFQFKDPFTEAIQVFSVSKSSYKAVGVQADASRRLICVDGSGLLKYRFLCRGNLPAQNSDEYGNQFFQALTFVTNLSIHKILYYDQNSRQLSRKFEV